MTEFNTQDYIDMEAPAQEMPPSEVKVDANGEKKTPGFLEWLKSPQALAMAGSLLRSGGYSPVPITTGAALGTAIGDMQAYGLKDQHQQLENSKFGYQQKHDTDQLNLQKQRFGIEDARFNQTKLQQDRLFNQALEKFKMDKEIHGADRSLKEAQVAHALQQAETARKQQEAFAEINRVMGGGAPQAAQPTQVPGAQPLPESVSPQSQPSALLPAPPSPQTPPMGLLGGLNPYGDLDTPVPSTFSPVRSSVTSGIPLDDTPVPDVMPKPFPQVLPGGSIIPPTIAPQTSPSAMPTPGMLNQSSLMPSSVKPGTPGLLGTPPITQVPPSAGVNKPSQADILDMLSRAAVINGKPGTAANILKTKAELQGLAQWETKEGLDPITKRPITIRINKVTGETQVVPGLSPVTGDANYEGLKTRIVEDAKAHQELRTNVNNQAYILDKFNTLRDLMKTGVETGAGFDQITTLQNIAKTMGLQIDPDKLSDRQFMKQQIESAFSDYQRGTRIPGIGSQSDVEFEALRKQFVTSDMTPKTLLNVMNAFQRNIMVKQAYVDQKDNWMSKFGGPFEKDTNGHTFTQVWRNYEKKLWSDLKSGKG